jgi:hypothetical protein
LPYITLIEIAVYAVSLQEETYKLN